ncbi:ABC-2 family transporter protein [Candidatus Gottesmanbacteria bacterium]|nr:ABC-2 family transporter protein [Candidatus Gottesmanbacteria bacterium]
MQRYLRVYRKLCEMSLETLMAYRANFINSMGSSFAWGIFSFISIFLLTSKTTSVYGWKREEIILLTCAYSIMIGVFHTLFSRNFERMAEIINFAQLDTFLVKPMDSQFLLSMRWVNYTASTRVLLGIGFLFYFRRIIAIELNPLAIALFFVLLFFGLLLLYSIWFIVATFLIWSPRLSNLIELMYSVSGMTRFPGEMYKNASEYLFLFLLPITLIITTPIKFLVARASLFDVLSLLFFAAVLFVISRKLWKFALRYYTSASS